MATGGAPSAKTGGQRLGVTRSRMRLIARDQTAKLNGRITEDLHRRAGITHHRWRTSRDRRVRSEHSAREGREIRLGRAAGGRASWAGDPVPVYGGAGGVGALPTRVKSTKLKTIAPH